MAWQAVCDRCGVVGVSKQIMRSDGLPDDWNEVRLPIMKSNPAEPVERVICRACNLALINWWEQGEKK